MTVTAYYAPAGYEEELARELADVELRKGPLFVARGPAQPVYWTQNVWYDVRSVRIASIKDAAQKLRAVQRNWAGHRIEYRAREDLIQQALPHISAKPLALLQAIPQAPMGAYTLIERDRLLYAPRTGSPFPRGEVSFIEDKTNPPGRAYLKLWELLTLTGRAPGPADVVVDLGSSPGGWTWVLSELGCRRVLSVDKAALDERIAGRANVEYLKADAFALAPRDDVDWVFSDVICDPARLYELVQRWRAAGHTRFVCTLKFKGQADRDAIRKFAAIEGSQLRHLYHNKHELTWTLGV